MLRKLFLLVCLTSAIPALFAQTKVQGKIIDIETNEGVSFCKVFFADANKKSSADFEGNFNITGPKGSKRLGFTFFGYDTVYVDVMADTVQFVNVEIKPKAHEIKRVVIPSSQENPAHRIMRKVVLNKKGNDGYKLDAFQHESYSKIEIDVDKMSEKFQSKKSVVKILNQLDSANRLRSERGTLLLPVFFSETHSEYFYNSSPELYRENILRTKISGVGITDGSFTSQLIGSYFQTYNIYNNYLNIAGRDFISPVTDRWKVYYDYKLEEFIDEVKGKLCYRLSFTPKRAQDLAFKGTMWITHDEYALKQIDVKIGREANLNFIEKVNITQEFTQVEDSGAWLANKTRIVLDVMQLGKNPGLIAKSYVSNYSYKVNKVKPTEFFDTKIVLDEDALSKDPTYWQRNRADSLTAEEIRIYGMIDTIKNVPVVKTYTEIVDLFVNGYKDIGKISIGPPLSIYAFNNIEGHRFSLGAKTNNKLSNKFFSEANLTYGTQDKQFKYQIKTEVLLAKRSYAIAGLHIKKDIEQIGAYNQFAANNSLFDAFNRWGTLRQPFMLDQKSVYVNTDLLKGVRQSLKLSTRKFDALFPFRYFTNPGANNNLDSQIRTTELTIGYRFGFKESYLFNDFDRLTVGMANKPVFNIYGVFGFRGFLDGTFDYQKFHFDMMHNVRIGLLGRLRYQIKVGYTPNILPYPLLESHLGNRTIFNNSASFNMMRVFEFVSDQFASLSLHHDFDGLVANRIPVFKKLKWRFFATSKVLVGRVSGPNKALIPALDENMRPLMQFGGLAANKPYMEFGYGISNIFRFIRVDFLHRANYLQGGANPFGVKVSMQFRL